MDDGTQWHICSYITWVRDQPELSIPGVVSHAGFPSDLETVCRNSSFKVSR